MWLLLCSGHDAAAFWAYEGLRARGLLPLELITGEMLLKSRKWEHRVDATGASISITLADGRIINNKEVRGTLNRLTYVPLESLASTPDYDYATQEYAAFFMSWLNALPPPVLNGAAAQGLCGAWRHVSEWVWLAAKAGIATPDYRQTSHDTFDEKKEMRKLFPEGTSTTLVLTVGERIVGPDLPREIRDGCLRLAQLAQTPLLGIELVRNKTSDSWIFAGATHMPDLRLGGKPLLDALAAELFKPRAISPS
jgi:hypothetical protein